MKFTFSIIFLLYFSFLFSQDKIENLTSITLYKVYNEPDDGFCNSFITKQSGQVVSKSIKDCDELVLELIKLKSNLKTRKSNDLFCHFGVIGCPSIEFMVTYQFNKLVDTLYFNNNEYEKVIIDWKYKKQFEDKNSEIIKILNKNQNFKKLIEINLDKIYRETFEFEKRDSMSIENLKINNKNFYGLNKIKIDSLIGGFNSYVDIEKDLNNKKDYYKYYSHNQDTYNEYFFVNDFALDKIFIKKIEGNGNYYPEDEIFNINGITLNDTEKLLIKKFTNSTKNLEYKKEFFKEENGDYKVSLKINDKKGTIDFIINNEKIKQIEIDFYYPKPKN
ncbi:hypothetical protein [Flavobacterium sp.]|uniref:hypothetical protein n=1 Tax=Flavobacterium sp. TaxID=239 RepID=UPI00375069D1